MLHGAPVATFDLDVVHARDRENIARLLAALEKLEAVYRADESHLAGPGHQLLLTKFGPLDVLGMIGNSRTWEDLREHTRTIEDRARRRVARAGFGNSDCRKGGTGISEGCRSSEIGRASCRERV